MPILYMLGKGALVFYKHLYFIYEFLMCMQSVSENMQQFIISTNTMLSLNEIKLSIK